MKKFSDKDQRMALVNTIKKLTGAKAVMLLICDSELPCKRESEGESCGDPHEADIIISGMNEEAVIAACLEVAMSVKSGKSGGTISLTQEPK